MHDAARSGALTVEIQVHPQGEGLPLPRYMSDGAAGCDVFAAVEGEVVIEPGRRTLIPLGFSMAVPPGFEAQIRPRSGLALEHGVTCLNSPGTIDSDYRGPVSVILINHGAERFVLHRGDRIAQMIVARVERAQFMRSDTLPDTPRASGGFGSTGRRERP
jgi:dUTP pyrophosphatase